MVIADALRRTGIEGDVVGLTGTRYAEGLGYRAKSYVIGSGMMESTCKQIVSQRLKGSGRQWSESGAVAMAHLVVHSLNEDWDRFWASRPLHRAE